jgi:hypothetical protein
METHTHANCFNAWYNKVASSMVSSGDWAIQLQMMPSCCRGNLFALVFAPNVISFFQVLTNIISLFSRGLKFMWNILKQFVSLRRGIIRFGVH